MDCYRKFKKLTSLDGALLPDLERAGGFAAGQPVGAVCPGLVADQDHRLGHGAGDRHPGGLLPQIVLGPFVGALVDRWNRRICMIVADSLIALATLGLVLLFWTGRVADLACLRVLMFVRSLGGPSTGRPCTPPPP